MDNMKISFSVKPIESASKEYARVRFLEEVPGGKRLVREDGIDWLEIATGKGEKMNRRKFITLCRRIIQIAKANKLPKIAVQFYTYSDLFKGLLDTDMTPEATSQLAAENYEMANLEFNMF